MRDRTRALHTQAERTGVVAALLRGQATREAYALYLRTLLPAYQALEAVLESGSTALLSGLAHPALFRTRAITADLDALAGANWQQRLPLLDSGRRYAARIESAACGDGSRLIAHCYTRYLGDLNGGQVIGRRLMALFGGDGWTPAFQAFPGIADPARFAEAFRQELNATRARIVDPSSVVDEAEVAFRLNVALSIEVSTTIR